MRRLALAGLLLLFGAATALAASGAPFVLGGSGVRRIQIGRTFAYLHARGLVRQLHPGCELAAGNDLYATIRGRVRGVVHFDRSRRATSVTVTGGAVTPRGVAVGDTLARVRSRYPGARYRLDPTFGVYFVHVGRAGRGYTITIGGRSRRVQSLAAHYPPVCE